MLHASHLRRFTVRSWAEILGTESPEPPEEKPFPVSTDDIPQVTLPIVKERLPVPKYDLRRNKKTYVRYHDQY